MPLSFTAGSRSLLAGILKRVTIPRAIFHLWAVLLGSKCSSLDAGSNAVFSIVGHINGWHFADCSFAGNGNRSFADRRLTRRWICRYVRRTRWRMERRRAAADNEGFPDWNLWSTWFSIRGAAEIFALLQIETEILPWVWIAGHAFSRFVSISQLRFASYVQDPAKSKSGSMTEFSGVDLIINAVFGLLPLLFIGNQVWMGLLAVVLVWWLSLVYFKRKLGGVTGDCLGATQQLSEVVFICAWD